MASKQSLKNKGITSREARRWIGHPVFVRLNDGNYYAGMVAGIEKGEVILADTKPLGRWSPSARSKGQVQVSGFLQNMFGGGGAFNPQAPNAGGGFNPFAPVAGGGGQTMAGPGGGNFFGVIKQMWPTVSIGLQMVKSIMPIMGLFKI